MPSFTWPWEEDYTHNFSFPSHLSKSQDILLSTQQPSFKAHEQCAECCQQTCFDGIGLDATSQVDLLVHGDKNISSNGVSVNKWYREKSGS